LALANAISSDTDLAATEGCTTRTYDAVAATVDPDTWELPQLFSTLQQAGQIPTQEMRDVFNLGVGLVAVLSPDAVRAAQAAASADGVTTWVMGEIQRGSRSVRFARP